MSLRPSILVVDDQPEYRKLLQDILRKQGHGVECAPSGEDALQRALAPDAPYSLILLDLDFGRDRMNGVQVIERLRAAGCDVPVVMLTGKGTIASAVAALKAGAADFLEKNAYIEDNLEICMEKLHRLLEVIQRYRRLEREADYLRNQVAQQHDMVVASPQMRAVMRKVKQVAPVPRPVLIRGERGTGKELVAAAIHRASGRMGAFITVNCAAIAPGLLECELFGQEENAFNNAPFKLGRFDLADSGTLFLDEIGNMSDEFQRKILRVIEYQSFQRVQGTETVKVDVRVIAATNCDLEAAIDAGQFRADLYDRLSFETIYLPPLRERKEEIEPLCYHFLQRFRQEVAGLPEFRVSAQALATLTAHDWPGNVRELKNVIERAAYQAPGNEITPEDLSLRPTALKPPELGEIAGTSLSDYLDHTERELALAALRQADWNQAQAAKLLGIKYDQLRHIYRKHSLGRHKPGP